MALPTGEKAKGEPVLTLLLMLLFIDEALVTVDRWVDSNREDRPSASTSLSVSAPLDVKLWFSFELDVDMPDGEQHADDPDSERVSGDDEGR